MLIMSHFPEKNIFAELHLHRNENWQKNRGL